jgi:hypothetical protein
LFGWSYTPPFGGCDWLGMRLGCSRSGWGDAARDAGCMDGEHSSNRRQIPEVCAGCFAAEHVEGLGGRVSQIRVQSWDIAPNFLFRKSRLTAKAVFGD